MMRPMRRGEVGRRETGAGIFLGAIVACLGADCGTIAPASVPPWPYEMGVILRVLSKGLDPLSCVLQPGMSGYPDGRHSVFRLPIQPDGTVGTITVARSGGLTPRIDACLIHGMQQWVFPPRQTTKGAAILVRVDFHIRSWCGDYGFGVPVYPVVSVDAQEPALNCPSATSDPVRLKPEWTRQEGSPMCRAATDLPPAGPATVYLALPPEASGRKEAVGAAIKSHVPEVRACYQARLIKPPYPTGRVLARIVLDPSGHVPSTCVATSTVHDPSIDRCIIDAAMNWVFPVSARKKWTVVEYPFVLVPDTAQANPPK
jgi:hypothetical protein